MNVHSSTELQYQCSLFLCKGNNSPLTLYQYDINCLINFILTYQLLRHNAVVASFLSQSYIYQYFQPHSCLCQPCHLFTPKIFVYCNYILLGSCLFCFQLLLSTLSSQPTVLMNMMDQQYLQWYLVIHCQLILLSSYLPLMDQLLVTKNISANYSISKNALQSDKSLLQFIISDSPCN